MRRLLPLVLALLFAFALPAHGATTPKPNHLQWDQFRIGSPSAWARGADGHGVSVLVIDTGLDRTVATTALAGNVLPSIAISPLHGSVAVPCPPGTNQFTGMPCSTDALIPNPHALVDTYGHGTFVACQIACHGLTYDYYGVAPKARIAMAKVFLSGGADTRDIARAIRWGVIHRFPIISMSLGGNPDPAMEAAVRFAVSHGTLVVAAAGNGGYGSLSYPAGYPGVISVAASDRWDKLASFSQYGFQSITAPGDWIFGIGPMHSSVINGGGLLTLPGTSMAAPEVAGALADLMSVGLTTWQAYHALLAGARHWPGMLHYQYGAGLLDLNGSLAYSHRMHWGRA